MWSVETLNAIVDAEIEALPKDMRARLVRVASLIEAVGFEGLPRDTVKHLEGKLWELRVKAASGISRAIYVTASGHRVVIVRAFVKKDAENAPARTRNCPPEGEGGHMTRLEDLHAGWIKDAEYRQEYEALDEEFSLAQALVEARAKAGLTQEELAVRMDTSQSAIARLEAGRSKPSARTLERFAKATGTSLRISFEPVRQGL